MKLYTIVSSLDIDNVLSAESLSPADEYSSRSYGYKYFNPFPNFPKDRIVLFNYIPYLQIIDNQRVNYPIVIEVDDNIQFKNIEILNKGIVFFNKTLYLHPYNCRLLFFSETALKECDLRCLDSKINKLYKHFHKEIISNTETTDISSIDFSNVQADQKAHDNYNNDHEINIKKGMMYGWYLGSTYNISPALAKLKSIENKLYDFIIAIKNNDGKLTAEYKKEIEILDKAYKDNDPTIKLMTTLWQKETKEFCSNQQKFSEFLKKYSSTIKKDFLRYNNIDYRKNIKIDDYEAYFDEVVRHNNNLLSAQKSIPTFYEDSQKDDNYRLFDTLIKNIFLNKKLSLERLRVERMNVAREFVEGIKNYIENENKVWQDSEGYNYLKSLLYMMSKSTPFDFSYTNNALLKSVAAFLLKGEDFDEMMNFLTYHSMDEYQYVMGFWGAASGYVGIPRKITKSIFESNDKVIVKKVYSHIYKQLFGFDLCDSMSGTVDNVNKPKDIEPNPPTSITSAEIVSKIKSHPDYKKKYDNYCDTIIENNRTTWDKIEELGRWKKFIEKVKKGDNNKQKPNKDTTLQNNAQPTLFENTETNSNGKYFYNDKNVWSQIEPLIADNDTKNEIKEDLNWFQNTFSKPKGERGYSYDDINEKDNKIVIEKFCNLKRGKNKEGKDQAPYFTEKLRQEIQQKLLSLYCNE